MFGAQHRASKQKLIVIIFKEEGIANHLVLFANFLGFAEEYGYQVINPTFRPYARFFYSTQHDPYCAYPVSERWWKVAASAGLGSAVTGLDGAASNSGIVRENASASATGAIQVKQAGRTRIQQMLEAAVENPNRVSIALPGVIVMHEFQDQPYTALQGPEMQAGIEKSRMVFAVGWNFRAADCVSRHAQKIRSYFRPVDHAVQHSIGTVSQLRRQSDIVVGVHVRHGDYRTWRGGENFYPVSQYRTWMHQIRDQLPQRRVSFLVCSDEQRNHSEFPGLQVAFGCPECPVGDLYGLAECDYIFGPVSTFSIWASFFGNKRLCSVRTLKDIVQLAACRIAIP